LTVPLTDVPVSVKDAATLPLESPEYEPVHGPAKEQFCALAPEPNTNNANNSEIRAHRLRVITWNLLSGRDNGDEGNLRRF
jgi:hypothetical protein